MLRGKLSTALLLTLFVAALALTAVAAAPPAAADVGAQAVGCGSPYGCTSWQPAGCCYSPFVSRQFRRCCYNQYEYKCQGTGCPI